MSGEEPDAAGGSRRPLKIVIVMIVIAGLVGAWYWWRHHGLESTDNAFIEASVVRVLPRVRGELTAVHVDDNQRVDKGELLFEIDDRDYRAAVKSAESELQTAQARVAEAQAQLDLARRTSKADISSAQRALAVSQASSAQARAEARAAQTRAKLDESDARRIRNLFKADSASRQALDRAEAAAKSSAAKASAAREAVAVSLARVAQARAAVDQAQAAARLVAVREAQLKSAKAATESARAALDQAHLNLSYTKVHAPQSGRITELAVSTGDMAQPERPLTALVFDTPWVVANFKETQLTRMRPGQPVKIEVDAYPGHTLSGHVDSIQSGTGARFSLLPPENATGNYVKVVQRVPVKILIDRVPDGVGLLAPGMSVVPTVDVSGGTTDGHG